MNLSCPDQIDVITLALKHLLRKPTKKGCSEFWHQHSIESTNTNQMAKLRVTDKSSVQAGLEFAKTVTTSQQNNRDFYESIVNVVEKAFKELCKIPK